jgi:hypothetical protein
MDRGSRKVKFEPPSTALDCKCNLTLTTSSRAHVSFEGIVYEDVLCVSVLCVACKYEYECECE